MDEENIIKIKQELSASNTGCNTNKVMDLILKKTGVKYHEIVFEEDCSTRGGFSLKVPEKKFVKRASDKEIKYFRKE
jgi:hypothetical protein